MYSRPSIAPDPGHIFRPEIHHLSCRQSLLQLFNLIRFWTKTCPLQPVTDFARVEALGNIDGPQDPAGRFL